MEYLDNLPKPKVTWLERCHGDLRLNRSFTKGMGYKNEDVEQLDEEKKSAMAAKMDDEAAFDAETNGDE